MKNYITGLLIIISFLMFSQTIEETESYINEKLNAYGTNFKEFIEVRNNELYLRYRTVPIYMIVKVQEVEFSYIYAKGKGVSEHQISFKCKNNSNCIKVMGLKGEEIQHTANAAKRQFYIFDYDAARRLETAFRHLQSEIISKNKKELFGY